MPAPNGETRASVGGPSDKRLRVRQGDGEGMAKPEADAWNAALDAAIRAICIRQRDVGQFSSVYVSLELLKRDLSQLAKAPAEPEA